MRAGCGHSHSKRTDAKKRQSKQSGRTGSIAPIGAPTPSGLDHQAGLPERNLRSLAWRHWHPGHSANFCTPRPFASEDTLAKHTQTYIRPRGLHFRPTHRTVSPQIGSPEQTTAHPSFRAGPPGTGVSPARPSAQRVWGLEAQMGAHGRCPHDLPEPEATGWREGLADVPPPGPGVRFQWGVSRHPWTANLRAFLHSRSPAAPAQNSPPPSRQLDPRPAASIPARSRWPCPPRRPQPSTCARPRGLRLAGARPPPPPPGRMAAPAAPPGGPVLAAQMCEAGAGPACAGLREGPSPAPRPGPLPAPLLRLAARRLPHSAGRPGAGEGGRGGRERGIPDPSSASCGLAAEGLPPSRPSRTTLGRSLGRPICEGSAAEHGGHCPRPLRPLSQTPPLSHPCLCSSPSPISKLQEAGDGSMGREHLVVPPAGCPALPARSKRWEWAASGTETSRVFLSQIPEV
ncbi:collagen alpha-1(I) chain-like [Cynocephalus volans]|uniref:collagen alpha-1(I) chain-like n=1 Tax=Cynocephalus volans TaxID=110931 RepID=UPI002FCA4A05